MGTFSASFRCVQFSRTERPVLVVVWPFLFLAKSSNALDAGISLGLPSSLVILLLTSEEFRR
jgi:hypothetical protein